MYLKIIDEKDNELLNCYETPFYVYLSLSNVCNANCSFCDVKNNKEKFCQIDVKKLIDELSELGTKYIQFTGGGEPFINDNIFEYLEYCTKKNIKIVLISNGLNLDEEKIKKICNYNTKAIIFSIDSCYPLVHDDLRGVVGIWERVTTNINLVKKYNQNIKIIINHVLNKRNIGDFDKFIGMKKTFDFDYINPIVIKDCDNLFFDDEQISHYNDNLLNYYQLADEMKISFFADNINFFENNVTSLGDRVINADLKCIYPAYCAFVDAPTGYVYPCDCSIHRDRTIYKIGDLKEQSFKEIWNGDKRRSLKEQLLNSELDCKLKCDEANCMFNNNYFKIRKKVKK